MGETTCILAKLCSNEGHEYTVLCTQRAISMGFGNATSVVVVRARFERHRILRRLKWWPDATSACLERSEAVKNLYMCIVYIRREARETDSLEIAQKNKATENDQNYILYLTTTPSPTSYGNKKQHHQQSTQT